MINTPPIISVIVPVYNGSDTIALCLSHLMSNDYPASSYEVIIVDNNSTDNTREIIIADGRARYICEKKQGQSAARNAGAKEAAGEIVAFIDADCLVNKLWLKEVEKSLTHKSVAVVGMRKHITRNSGDELQAEDYYRYWEKEIASGHLNKLCGSNFAMYKEFFWELGGFDEDLLVYEDIELGFRITENSGKIRFNKDMFVHHIYLDSIDSRFKKIEKHGGFEYNVYQKHRKKNQFHLMMPSFKRRYFIYVDQSKNIFLARLLLFFTTGILTIGKPLLMFAIDKGFNNYLFYKFVMNVALFKGKMKAMITWHKIIQE